MASNGIDHLAEPTVAATWLSARTTNEAPSPGSNASTNTNTNANASLRCCVLGTLPDRTAHHSLSKQPSPVYRPGEFHCQLDDDHRSLSYIASFRPFTSSLLAQRLPCLSAYPIPL